MTPNEEKALEIFRKAIALGFADLCIKVQDGKLVSATITEKIKL